MAWYRQEHVPKGQTVSLLGPSTTARTSAMVTPEGGSVRWRADGTPPTATEGIPLFAGERQLFDDPAWLADVRFACIDTSEEAPETWLHIHVFP